MEKREHILIITINNPSSAINAVDDDLHHDLNRLFALLKEEQDFRAVVLTGHDNFFSAGGDFNWLGTFQDESRLIELLKAAKQIIWNLVDIEIPIVAAVNGPAIGLGASLALLCDIVFMSDRATIADPHVRVGIVAGDGGVVAWPLALGPARAKEFLLTGNPLTAQDAAQIGLVNRVVPESDLMEESIRFAATLAEMPPLAVQYTKASINKLVKEALNTAFDTSTALEMITFRSQDHREALAAIKEKRKPTFLGK